jgi:hypothetical protein
MEIVFYIITGILVLTGIYLGMKKGSSCLIFFVCVSMLQNIVLIILSNYLPKANITIMLLTKELVIYSTIIISFIRNPKLIIKKQFLWPVVLALFCLAYFFLGEADTFTKLVSLRQMIMPFALILFGFFLNIDEEGLRKVAKVIIIAGLIDILFGVFEAYVIGDRFWSSLHYEKFYEYKGIGEWATENMLVPRSFYTWDFVKITGYIIRRMVGIVADPILSAHILALCFGILLFAEDLNIKKNIRYVLLGIFAIGLILSLSKGAFIVTGILILFKIRQKYKRISNILFAVTGVTIVAIIGSSLMGSVGIHFSGLVSALTPRNLLGHGIGMGGDFAGLFGDHELMGGEESLIGAIIVQIGLAGAVIYLLSLFLICKESLMGKSKESVGFPVVIFCVAVILESFLSESAISYIGTGTAFAMLGIVFRSIINVRNLLSEDKVMVCEA